jgi:hypothetical protein
MVRTETENVRLAALARELGLVGPHEPPDSVMNCAIRQHERKVREAAFRENGRRQIPAHVRVFLENECAKIAEAAGLEYQPEIF